MTTSPSLDPAALLAELSDVDQLTARVQLANYGLAAPSMTMVRGQSQFEAMRAAEQEASDEEIEARRAIARRAVLVEKSFAEETGRAQVFPPVVDLKDEAAIYGRIVDQGIPVEAATVMALDESGESPAFTCTGKNGDFNLVVSAPATLRLRVVDKDGAEVHVDRIGTGLTAGDRKFREVELTLVDLPCPPPEPPPPPPEEPVEIEVPQLVGRSESEALKVLKAIGLQVGERTTKVDDAQQGRVLSHKPEEGSVVKPGVRVDMVIGVRRGIPVPDLEGLTFEAADKRLTELDLRAVRAGTRRVEPDNDGLVVDQKPSPDAELEAEQQVRLTIGEAAELALAEIAEVAEIQIRDRDVGRDNADGWVLRRIEAAGVRTRADLEGLLEAERDELRTIFEVRTLKATDAIRAELNRALKPRSDG